MTPQELCVAEAVAHGASNREIAAEMFLAPETIEFHLRQVYGKLGVRSRARLAATLARQSAPGRPPDAESRWREPLASSACDGGGDGAGRSPGSHPTPTRGTMVTMWP